MDKYINPETNRKVKQNTKTFNKLLKKYKFDKNNGFEFVKLTNCNKTTCQFMKLVKEKLLTNRKGLTEPQQELYDKLTLDLTDADIQKVANVFKLNIKITTNSDTCYFKGNDQNKTLKLYYDNFKYTVYKSKKQLDIMSVI